MSSAVAARLAPDSFLPSGGRDNGVHLPFAGLATSSSDSSSSVISPLALPRGAMGYFDHISNHGNYPTSTHGSLAGTSSLASKPHVNNHKVYSPLSPSFRAIPQPQPAQFLSPHLAPTVRDAQYHVQLQARSSSLSPSRITTGAARDKLRNELASLGRAGRNGPSFDGFAVGFADSTSPNQGAGSIGTAIEQAQLHNVHRLLQQNARIRGAWEAERKYLEANRERAEEVYKEEQALMEEDRSAWDVERVQLLQQIEALRQERSEWDAERERLLQQIQNLQQTVASLEPSNAAARRAQNDPGAISERAPGETGGDASHDSRGVAFQSSGINASFAPTQTEGQSRSPPSHQPSAAVASSLGYYTIPGPLTASDDMFSDMLSPDQEDSDPVPVVDVKEIHPDLEGIPIKANAIQRPTFTDGPSPPGGSRLSSSTPSPTEPGKDSTTKEEPRQKTLQVLAAAESDRLVMHAGHTPNHSMSVIPTSVASRVPTASSSGDSTPTMRSARRSESVSVASGSNDDSKRCLSAFEPAEPVPTGTAQFDEEGDPEALLEPTEDRELKGPLMIRNIPATDEIFLRKLSDKLEEVSLSPEIAVPAVLKNESVDEEETEAPGAAAAAPSEINTGADGTNEAEDDNPKHDKSPGAAEELDIPLKIKKSNNFGAPFGEWH